MQQRIVESVLENPRSYFRRVTAFARAAGRLFQFHDLILTHALSAAHINVTDAS